MEQKPIDRFIGDYYFLSNFYPCRIDFEGVEYPSVEHAFQAAKTLSRKERLRIKSLATAAEAKKAGRRVELRAGWDELKVDLMRELLRKKFSDDPLAGELLDTRDCELIEGNTWGDCFWGVYRRNGKNMLGKLLMEIRGELTSKGWHSTTNISGLRHR